METKEIVVKDKKFVVHELLAIENDEIQEIEGRKERWKSLIMKSANLSDEDYKSLTAREQGAIIKVMNELNGWNTDFQKSEVEEKKD